MEYLQGGDKEIAEGVVFARAILPRVAACSSTDAATIYYNMANFSTDFPCTLGASDSSTYNGYSSCTLPDFSAVKTAFENNYDCLGVTCSDIGGLLESGDSAYYDGASPCSDDDDAADDDEEKTEAWQVVVIVIGTLAFLTGAMTAAWMYAKWLKIKKDYDELKESAESKGLVAVQGKL